MDGICTWHLWNVWWMILDTHYTLSTISSRTQIHTCACKRIGAIHIYCNFTAIKVSIFATLIPTFLLTLRMWVSFSVRWSSWTAWGSGGWLLEFFTDSMVTPLGGSIMECAGVAAITVSISSSRSSSNSNWQCVGKSVKCRQSYSSNMREDIYGYILKNIYHITMQWFPTCF